MSGLDKWKTRILNIIVQSTETRICVREILQLRMYIANADGVLKQNTVGWGALRTIERRDDRYITRQINAPQHWLH